MEYSFLQFDDRAMEALHLFPSSAEGLSLMKVVDHTRTAMGRQRLRAWMRQPLTDLGAILRRREAVKALVQKPDVLCALRDQTSCLKRMADLDSLLARQKAKGKERVEGVNDDSIEATGRTSSNVLRDIAQLYRTLAQAQAVVEALGKLSSGEPHAEVVDLTGSQPSNSPEEADAPPSSPEDLPSIAAAMVTCLARTERFRALVEHVLDVASLPNLSAYRGRLTVNPACTPALQNLHRDLQGARDALVQAHQNILQSTGLQAKDLKLEYSEVHGWHLRVTKTLANKSLKLLGSKKMAYRVLSLQRAGTLFLPEMMQKAVDRLRTLEKRYEEVQLQIVQQAQQVVLTYVPVLQTLSGLLASIDALASLAFVAVSKDWVAPQLTEGGGSFQTIVAENVRHPILEEQLGPLGVIPNNVSTSAPCRLTLLTGPNMGGKSTYLRAIALLVILAQMGSYVPAKSASLTLFDRICVRSGATDHPAVNQSTFMNEMQAMADILSVAGSTTLVVLDEVGRGTSTNDGFGLAYALLAHLALESKCITYCATHFHDLVRLEQELGPVVRTCHVTAALQEGRKDDVTMLYKVKEGSSDASLGIAVAKMAGFPDEITREALLLEESNYRRPSKKRKIIHALDDDPTE